MHNGFKVKNGILVGDISQLFSICERKEYQRHKYVGVIECKSCPNPFFQDIPCFLFPSDVKFSCNYSEKFKQQIIRKCIRLWPKFELVVKVQMEAVWAEENGKRFVVNQTAFDECPIIGFFHVWDVEDYESGKVSGDVPYGLMIARNVE